MQRQPIFHLQRQITGARIEAGINKGIDLPVLVGIGPVQFCLKNQPVQKNVGVQAGQRTHDVVGAKVMVALDVDRRQPAFGHLQLDGRVVRAQFLSSGHAHRDRR